MKLEDLLGLAIPVAFILFWGSEYLVNRAGGGRTFPKVRWWFVPGAGFLLILSAVNATAPLWLPPDWLARHRLMDLTRLGVGWGALLAYAATSFAMYWFHRAEPKFTVLWRGLHQFHHSIERVDMGGWAVGHPLETVIQTAYITGVSTFVLGLDPMAAALAGTFGTIVNMFSHRNVSSRAGWAM